jgi:hypothetical protein
LTRLEEGDGLDSRVPPVSGWSKKEKGREAELGRRDVELGHWAVAGAREKKKKGLPAWALADWARRKKGERERGRGKGFAFFFF